MNPEQIFYRRGIYFLWRDEKIVYIGKSGCMVSRVAQHRNDKKKHFDSVTFKDYDVSDKQLSAIEASLIRRYKPEYNIVHKRKRKTKPDRVAWKLKDN